MITPDFAIHHTWTCYGNWLPGDPRGSVSNTLVEGVQYLKKQNVPQSPYADGDATLFARAKLLQKRDSVRLNLEQARIVGETLIEAAAKREWHIGRAAIMSNHVYVVVMNCPNDGAAVRRIFKGTTQAALSRHCGRPRVWWTDGGSDRYKNDECAVETALNYVAGQDHILAEVVAMKLFMKCDNASSPRPSG